MENPRKGKISEEQHVDPRVRVQEDGQEAARSHESIDGVAAGGRSTNGHDQNDVINQLFLRLDMRGALPQAARSPKSRSTKVGTGGQGTALRYSVAGSRKATSLAKNLKKRTPHKHRVAKTSI